MLPISCETSLEIFVKWSANMEVALFTASFTPSKPDS